jgi:2-isopropylmalate synthase
MGFCRCRAVPPNVARSVAAFVARRSECRALPRALRGAAHPRIHTFVATSDLHLEYKLKKTRAEVIRMTRDAVRLARSYAEEIEFSAEDATRSDVTYLCDVFAAAVDEGATILNVPDTVGYTLPNEFAELVRTVRERVVGDRTDITISVHCHNDLGLAVRQ